MMIVVVISNVDFAALVSALAVAGVLAAITRHEERIAQMSHRLATVETDLKALQQARREQEK